MTNYLRVNSLRDHLPPFERVSIAQAIVVISFADVDMLYVFFEISALQMCQLGWIDVSTSLKESRSLQIALFDRSHTTSC